MPARPARSLPALLAWVPRELAVAAAVGLGVGTFAVVTAYALYVRAAGPTVPGVTVILLSAVVLGVFYVALGRRKKSRASDWLALGYTAAILIALAVFTVHQALAGVYRALNVTVW
ncbi:MAG TPA: hypothetical protein VKA21_02755 [Candidatus Binatia bacterium]|nr:hypothetical protein [Candidatus Binatia bacterium]